MIKSKNKVFEKFEKYDFELWKKSLNGHLSGIFIATKSVANYMLKRKPSNARLFLSLHFSL